MDGRTAAAPPTAGEQRASPEGAREGRPVRTDGVRRGHVPEKTDGDGGGGVGRGAGVDGDEGVVGDGVPVGHHIEHPPGIAEGSTSGVGGGACEGGSVGSPDRRRGGGAVLEEGGKMGRKHATNEVHASVWALN